MTHRLDVHGSDGDAVVLEFQGLLDAGALEGLRAAVASARLRAAGVRVVLRVGTDVDRACLPALRALGAQVTAESAYLASWLDNGQ